MMNASQTKSGTLYQGVNGLPIEVITATPLSSPRPTPLLFVHGAWHGAWCWSEHFLPYFSAKGYESHALNLRGHGHSPIKGSVRFARINDFVADLEEVAAQMPTPPVLIGHSMGGFIIQKYLERHDDTPAAVLLTPPPPWGVRGAALRMARHDLRSLLQTNLQMGLYPAVDTPEKAQWLLFSADMPSELVQEYFRKLENDSFLGYLDMLIFDLPNPKPVKSPLLVLGAADDHNFSAAEIEATALAYHASYEIFPKMAHDMMLEQGWERVAARIAAWLHGQRI
jgi:pimeloyl-ACP methyl ester carboxylesterase